MFSFPGKSRNQRGKSLQKRQPTALEQQLFGSPNPDPVHREGSASDWRKSSNELREGCEVTQDVELDTLPPEWIALFSPAPGAR